MSHQRQWKQRRVAFVTSDDYHTLHLINVQMPVRLKERGETDTTFEGPIKAKWDTLPDKAVGGRDPILGPKRSLVGVLYANDQDYPGRINWLLQSTVAAEIEEGADLIAE